KAAEESVSHPVVAEIRARWKDKKQAAQQTVALNSELDAVDTLLKANDFTKAGDKLSAAEQKFAASDRVKRLRRDFDEKKTAYEAARSSRILGTKALLVDAKSDLAEIERKIADLETI